RGNAALVAKKEMNLRPLNAILEPLGCQQFINLARGVPSREGDTKPLGHIPQLIGVLDKPFNRSQRKLFRCFENKDVGLGLHGRSKVQKTTWPTQNQNWERSDQPRIHLKGWG